MQMCLSLTKGILGILIRNMKKVNSLRCVISLILASTNIQLLEVNVREEVQISDATKQLGMNCVLHREAHETFTFTL